MPASRAPDEVRTGHHFGRTALSPIALGLLIVLGGAAAVGGSIALGPAGAAGGAAIVTVLWLLIVAVIAGGRARTEFFGAYAAQRGLQWTRRQGLPEATPLLRMGDSRRADEVLTGTLPGGLEGSLALYTYEEHKRGSDGTEADEYHHFTLVLAKAPEMSSRLPALYVQRRFGFRFLDGAEDVFRETKRIELESAKLDERCEIFADPGCDANWIRQLFSPSFVVFLAEETPEGFAFEVEGDVLCVNQRRHKHEAADLDALCEHAATVARRLHEETAEPRS
jgi:hypothetical protein